MCAKRRPSERSTKALGLTIQSAVLTRADEVIKWRCGLLQGGVRLEQKADKAFVLIDVRC